MTPRKAGRKVFRKPKWADGEPCEVIYSPTPPRMTFILRWPEWAHRFTLAGGKDLFDAGIMEQIRALFFGYAPSDWDLIGAEHVQRVLFTMPTAVRRKPREGKGR